MTLPQWKWSDIADAYERVATGSAKRIDGAGWSVYAVGNIIRIDVKGSQ